MAHALQPARGMTGDLASPRHSLGERLGEAAGALLAPLTGLGSLARRARLFHPDGIVLDAVAHPVASDVGARLAANRLSGPVLARFSAAWWRDREWPDLLGLALRFGEAPGADPRPGDQDLLLATVRSPWRIPLAVLSTKRHDFLENQYFAVSPFDVDGVGRADLRVVPVVGDGHVGHTRDEKLIAAALTGTARIELQLRRRGTREWLPVVELLLGGEIVVPPRTLVFSPFRDGRGLHPRGFVHALRRATYEASQSVRPLAPA